MGVKRRRETRLIGWTVRIVDSTRMMQYARDVCGLAVVVTHTKGADWASLRMQEPVDREAMYGRNIFIADLPVEGNDIAGTLQRVNLMLKYGGLGALATLKAAMDTLRTL